jgi:hypothetical protein
LSAAFRFRRSRSEIAARRRAGEGAGGPALLRIISRILRATL